MPSKLTHRIQVARRKLARALLGLQTAHKQVKRHKRAAHQHEKLAKGAEARNEREVAQNEHQKAAFHEKKMRAWQKRQAALAKKHRYLQTVFKRRLAKKVKWLEEHKDEFPPSSLGGDIVQFDGHDVPKWMAEIDQEARDAGYWNGYVISGVRSPEYSEQLCYGICGHPSCPGLCAGRSSEHACPPSGKGVPYEGAEDVTDPAGLRRFCEAHGKPLQGGGKYLPSDQNHFSHSGH